MKVKWTREHLLGLGRLAKVGEVADLPPHEAQMKVNMGFAAVVNGEKPAAPPMTTDGLRTGDPSARTADPKKGDAK